LRENNTTTSIAQHTLNSALGPNQYWNEYRQFTTQFTPTVTNPWVRFWISYPTHGSGSVFISNIELDLYEIPKSNDGSHGGSGGGATYANVAGKSKYYDLNDTLTDINGGSATISTNLIAYGNYGGVGQDNGYWPSGGGGGAGGVGGSPSDQSTIAR